MTAPPPHALRAAALEELARPPQRRPLFRRPTPGQLHVLVGRDADRAGAGGDVPDPASAPVGGGGQVGDAGGPVPATVRRARGPEPLGPTLPFGGSRAVAALAAVVVVAALVLVLGWIRRPPPAEDTLPRAATTGEASPPDADGSTTVVDAATSAAPAGAAASGPVTVHVAGAVTAPGVVSLPAGSRAVDAVTAAGGLAAGADPDRVNLAAELTDGQRLVVPLVGQPPPAEVAPTGTTSPGSGAAAGGGPVTPVDLNSATADQLDALPGVGPATAQAIIGHREQSGAFRSVEDLLDVRGIGEAKLESLRDLVTVSG